MKLLYIGDIVGRAGRTFLARALPVLVKVYGCDLVIANAENAAGGSGLTPQIFEKLMRYGVNVVTLGDHCYRRREVMPLLAEKDNIVRPANLPPGAVGRGFTTVATTDGVTVGVVVLIGRLYMKPADCPFRAVDAALSQLKNKVDVTVVEIHAEATSEKIALGWYLAGRTAAVIGTHTHVPTADGAILPGGTAYITDLGMTGPYDSVLGRDKTAVIKSLVSGMPIVYGIADGDLRVGGLLVTVDTATGRAVQVEQLIVTEQRIRDLEAELAEPGSISDGQTAGPG